MKSANPPSAAPSPIPNNKSKIPNQTWLPLAFGLLLLAAPATQAEVTVSNVSATQTPGTKQVVVTYDVAADTATVAIALEVRDDDTLLPAISLSGDIGAGVSVGSGKQIVWDAGTDWPGQEALLMILVVAPEAVHDGEPPPGMVTIPAGKNQGLDPDFGYYSLSVDSFYMDIKQVSKVQWDQVASWAAANGYDIGPGTATAKGPDHPAGNVSWYDSVKWSNARSEKEGRTPCYLVGREVYRTGIAEPTCVFGANGYRLPTEVEWEYAARGGAVGQRFPWGNVIDHGHANYVANGARYSYDVSDTTMETYHPDYAVLHAPFTAPVGSFPANGFGLYDMAGNLAEWCWDALEDGRAVRGGSWYSGANYLRTGHSEAYPPIFPYDDFRGLRTVCRGVGGRAAYLPVDTRDFTLTVTSCYGTPSPARGTTTYAWGATVICTVDALVTTDSRTVTNIGWVGSGSVPLHGDSNTTGAITLNDVESSLTWIWSGYTIRLHPGLHGSITEANDDNGFTAFLGYGEPFPEISIVADHGYTFIGFEPELPETVKGNIEATAQYVEKLEITNLSATQREGTRLVDIYYNVNGGQGETVAVDLFVKVADEWIAPLTATGDLGTGVERGADRYIVWDAEADWDGNIDEEVTFHLQASERVDGGDPFAKSWEVIDEKWVRNVYADGSATFDDRVNGTQWMDGKHGYMWFEAIKEWAETLAHAGYSDWRLPTGGQLYEIYIRDRETFMPLTGREAYLGHISGWGIHWHGFWSDIGLFFWFRDGSHRHIQNTAAAGWPVRTSGPPPMGVTFPDAAVVSAAVDTRDYTLTVISPHGTPSPTRGTHRYSWRSEVTCTVDTEVTEGEDTFTCNGWTGAGAIPVYGSIASTGPVILTELDSFITWNWLPFDVVLHPGEHGSIAEANNGSGYTERFHAESRFPDVTVVPDAGYDFVGWDPPAPEFVGADFKATAQYERQAFTVTFLPGDHGHLEGETTQTIYYGESAVPPVVTTDENWVFMDWDTPFNSVTSDLTITALYTPQMIFTVTFLPGSHGTLEGETVQTVDYGNPAIAPTVVPFAGAAFDSWNTNFESVTANLTITARYIFDTEGDGSENAPYQIWNRTQLELVNTKLNAHYVLMADIDLAGVTYEQAVIAPSLPGQGWSSPPKFTGVFNGNGYVIHNLYIEGGHGSNLGLFGYIESTWGNVFSGIVRDLEVRNANIHSDGQQVGILAGRLAGTVLGCSVSGTVKGGHNVGGVIGYSFGTIIGSSAILDSVEGFSYIGGLVGCADSSSGTYKSAATGTVSGYYNVGGLTGWNRGRISDSYFEGMVSGLDIWGDFDGGVGGLIGHNLSGDISNCYAAATLITPESTQNVGALIGAIAGGTVTASFWDADVAAPLDSSAAGDGKTTAEMQTEATFLAAGWDLIDETANGTENIWQVNDGDYPRHAVSRGDGSMLDPYQIRTREDLEAVNDNLDAHYVLMNDINLSGVTFTTAVIGMDQSTPFRGTFNGGGYTIRNLTINAPDSYLIGLFGFVSQHYHGPGVHTGVRNLVIENADISAYGSAGILVGYAHGSCAISSCTVTGTVTGHTSLGGLLGNTGWSGDNSGPVLTDCHADAKVTGSARVGGLVGRGGDTTLINCTASGDVSIQGGSGYLYGGGLIGEGHTVTGSSASGRVTASSGHFVGGLVGYAFGTISKSFATGDVVSTAWYTGGLVGLARSDVVECYAAGNVSGREHVGGLVGKSNATIRRSYALGDVTAYWYTGGLAGEGNAEDCFALGDVSGLSFYTGGLVGSGDAIITRCYSAGKVTGNSPHVGGLVGTDSGGDPTTASFWDVQASGIATSYGGVGKTTAQMKTASTFEHAGWDLGSIWGMSATGSRFGGYPVLVWQLSYTVTFRPGTNGHIVSGNAEQTLGYREAATAPVVQAHEGWLFHGWDAEFDEVTSNLIVTAQYTRVQRALTILSARGAPVPAVGVHSVGLGSEQVCTVPSPAVDGHARYICVGWTGSGSAPESGTDASTGVFIITEDSSVTWHWSTEYYLDTEAGPGGSIDVNDGWHADGHVVTITATPEMGMEFEGWSGDIGGGEIDGNTLSVPMSRARTIIASFTSLKHTVTFKGGTHGTIVAGLPIQRVEPGAAAIPPYAEGTDDWVFDQWDTDFSNVTSDLTVTALYIRPDPFGEPVDYAHNLMRLRVAPVLLGHPPVHGDVVAAFVGDELRGKAYVRITDGTAVAELSVGLAGEGEILRFEGWESISEVFHLFHETVTGVIGGSIGREPDTPMSLTVRYAVRCLPGDHGWIAEANDEDSFIIHVAHGEPFPVVTVEPHPGYSFIGWNPSAPAIITGDFTTTALYEALPDAFAHWLVDEGLSGNPAALFRQICPVRGVAHGFRYAFGTNLPPERPLLTIRTVDGRLVVETPAQDDATRPYVDVRVVATDDLASGDWPLPMAPSPDTTGKPADANWYKPVAPGSGHIFFRLEAELH